ncbi:hypothetical protein G4Z05_00410 [Bacillus thermocopriae]|uniref:PIN domain-containing protein n=1 Tax=Neobacillus thermocopriae TaxID=1215031 RepID=A0A6B3TKA9_9BACI|nr:hypothetical protein [Neobacillus thermocopriae]NEX77365.1 hypothetical protein [Neobacillus thermocopriae]
MTRTSVSFDIDKKNWNNKNTFPDFVYTDANSVLEIFFNRQYGQVTEDYINELVNNRNGFITWSQHTIDEITQVIHVDEYFKLAKAKKIRGKNIWKVAENTATEKESISIAQNVLTKVDSIITTLEQFGGKTEVDEQATNALTKHIYLNYGLSIKDAKHLAIANLSGINNILTHDAGFLRFPNINVYGASKEIVRNYIPGQAPSPYVDLSKQLILQQSEEEIEDENAS